MYDTQQKQKNILDMAMRESKKRQQPSRDHQQMMKDAKLQSQERQQPSRDHQQTMENAKLQSQERQRMNSTYQRDLEDSRKRAVSNYSINPGNTGENSGGVSNAINTAKNLSKLATPGGIFSVLKQISFFKDIPFFCAIGFAVLKDLVDSVLNLTVVLAVVTSACCSFFIFFMLLLAGESKKRKQAKGIVKSMLKPLIIIAGGTADSIPGIGFLPIESITAIVIYILVLFERAGEEAEQKQ